MLIRATTAVLLAFGSIVPAFAQGQMSFTPGQPNLLQGQSAQHRPPTEPQFNPAAQIGQPSTGQPAGLGAPPPSVSGNYGGTYTGSYGGSYSNSYSSTYGGTYGATGGQ